MLKYFSPYLITHGIDLFDVVVDLHLLEYKFILKFKNQDKFSHIKIAGREIDGMHYNDLALKLRDMLERLSTRTKRNLPEWF